MARLTMAEALEIYAAQAGQVRLAQHLSIIRRYLLWGGNNSDAKLAAYVQHLEEQGLKGSTIDLHVRIIRAFWRRLGVPVPKAPEVTVQSDRIALSPEQVRALIEHARQELGPREQAILAISTVYGLRAIELVRLRKTDMDFPGERIFIRTAKGGVQRWQWLPPALHPLLQKPWPRMTEKRLRRYWATIWSRVTPTETGVTAQGIAFHAVRRALVRDLIAAGVSEEDVSRFMRWRTINGQRKVSMAQLYAHPTAEVQADGTVAVTAADPGSRAADAAVWAAHPYLRYWTD